MKRLLFITCLLGVALNAKSKSALDSLLVELDQTVKNHISYEKHKENRITDLKNRLAKIPNSSSGAYDLTQQLYGEYRAYQCDSALLYLNKCIEIAEYLRDNTRKYADMLQLAYLMGSSGMYKESIDVLESIDRMALPEDLLEQYYSAQQRVYGELGFYTQDKKKSGYYSGVAQTYKDSLLTLLPDSSDYALSLKEESMRYYNPLGALTINDLLIAKLQAGTHDYAIAAWRRAMIFSQLQNPENAKYWFAQSAASDIQSVIKDHASLWMLARILYHEGDIDRAYTYIRFSWSESVFYNARLRNLQSAVILSLIDDTYQIKMTQKNQKLQNQLVLVAIISVILLVATYLIFRQTRRLSVARRRLQDTNQQLKDLNAELNNVNAHLQESNINLQESNQIKEEYIGRFLKLCSTYIENLDIYRKMVNRKIMNGQIDELLAQNRSQDDLEKALEELYAYFDEAFLHFYPTFVEQVNALLQTPIMLNEKEILNTELRILALIRLGIDNSVQIADFLHYSINTIYNYRAKMKNRAIGNRDEFENQVRLIK
ncbi:MAG: DUF6377 domain-containing protein [Dysgonamonadaceae bacterium]|jgi:hypothetical protein|nr:DUF6377 domain-containing protein [Dysgonamonadaceae bacterium]